MPSPGSDRFLAILALTLLGAGCVLVLISLLRREPPQAVSVRLVVDGLARDLETTADDVRGLLEATGIGVVGAGGVGTLADLRTLSVLEVHGRRLAGTIVGRALYEAAFERAASAGAVEVTCEVNVEPPNPDSQAFHARLGFVEVGRQWTYDDTVQVQLLARPL